MAPNVFRIPWLQVLMLTLHVTVSLQASISPGRSKADQQLDACPDTLKGSDKNYKMVSITMGEIMRICCGANPGFLIKTICKEGKPSTAEYAQCDPGWYIADFAHNRTSCFKQIDKCSQNEVLIAGNESIPSRCDCQDGYHMTVQKRCKPHSSCLSGEGVDSLGSPDHDTICKKCRYGYHSLSDSPIERCTRISKQKIGTTMAPTTVASDEKKTKEMPSTPLSIPIHVHQEQMINAALISIVVTFIITIIGMVGVAVLTYRFYQNQQSPPQICAPIPNPNINQRNNKKHHRRRRRSRSQRWATM